MSVWKLPYIGKRDMNESCRNHDMWHSVFQSGLKCVAEVQEITELIKPGPLRVAYYNYRHYHGKFCS